MAGRRLGLTSGQPQYSDSEFVASEAEQTSPDWDFRSSSRPETKQVSWAPEFVAAPSPPMTPQEIIERISKSTERAPTSSSPSPSSLNYVVLAAGSAGVAGLVYFLLKPSTKSKDKSGKPLVPDSVEWTTAEQNAMLAAVVAAAVAGLGIYFMLIRKRV